MAKDEFTKLMKKGEVDDSYNMRGDNVASSRSSSRVEKKNIVKKDEQQQQELPEWAKNMPDEIVIKTWEID